MTEDVYKKIGIFVRVERERIGLTQKQLSQKSGVSLSTLHAIENGSSTASIGNVTKVLESLGFSLFEAVGSGHTAMEFKSAEQNLKVFSQNLRRICEEKKLTLYKIAEITGLEYSTIHSYFSGRRAPSVPSLKALAKGLGVSPEELFEKPKENQDHEDTDVLSQLETRLNELATKIDRGVGYLEAIIKGKK